MASPPATRPEAMLFELSSDVSMIVDLAVESEDIAAAVRLHGLAARFREIDHRKSPVPKPNSRTGIYPHIAIIWSSMLESRDHPTDEVRSRPTGSQNSSDSTHVDARLGDFDASIQLDASSITRLCSPAGWHGWQFRFELKIPVVSGSLFTWCASLSSPIP